MCANFRARSRQGDHLKGDNLKGDHLKGDNLKGDHLKGDHLKGDHLKGDDLKGDHLKGDHLKGDHLKGDHLNVKTLSSVLQKGSKTLPITQTCSNTHPPYHQPLHLTIQTHIHATYFSPPPSSSLSIPVSSSTNRSATVSVSADAPYNTTIQLQVFNTYTNVSNQLVFANVFFQQPQFAECRQEEVDSTVSKTWL